MPWGTPDVTGAGLDWAPSMTTLCVVSERKDLIQWSVDFLTP